MTTIRTNSLHWTLGALLALFGVLMLVTPHHFASPVYTLIQPHLTVWGFAFVLAGVALLVTVTLAARRRWVVAARIAAAGMLLLLAVGFVVVSAWTATVFYGTLGVGCLGAAVLPATSARRPRRDFFALLIGVSMVLNGLLILVAPHQFSAAVYDLMRPYLPWIALVFLSGGAALLIVNGVARSPRWAIWVAHLLAAAGLYGWMTLNALSWVLTGVVYSAVMGSSILALPWLGPRLDAFDGRRLHVRLGLTLATSAAVPLILAMAMMTQQQQELTITTALADQQQTAQVLAQDVAAYLRLHRGAVVTVAQEPDLLALPPAEQVARLGGVQAAFPDFALLNTFDARGNALVRTDGLPLSPPAEVLPLFTEARRTGQPVITLGVGPVRKRPRVEISAPVFDGTGAFAGIILGVIDIESFGQTVARVAQHAATSVTLVDADGRLIAQADVPVTEFLRDRSTLPPVAALQAGGATAGALRYREGGQDRLAGFARLPEGGWGVVVEEPTSVVLANIYAGRDLAFGVLMLMLAGAAAIGTHVAHHLTRPLDQLAQATARVADDHAPMPLPRSGIREVADLTAIFAAMRERLAARTAERDRLYVEERAARTEAEQAIQLRDAFLSIAAHELRNVLSALVGRAHLLQRRLHAGAQVSERDERTVRMLAAQGQRMTRLITGMLDFSQLEQGQLQLEVAALDVGALAERVVAEIEPTLDTHQVAYQGPPDPVLVQGDALRLEQVLLNLLQNAVRYSPHGGPVMVQLHTEAAVVRLSVRDQGIGIPVADRSRLFTRFARGGNAATHQIRGTGLGLYVVGEIVRMHGGQVEVDSTEGVGSTFTVILPRQAEDSAGRTVAPVAMLSVSQRE